MPVIAVGIAIAAGVTAAGAVTAVGLTVVTALEITAAVGAAVSAVGAVTGNKTLSTVGTVIGAVGAVGGFAAGAGLLGESAASNAPLFGTAPASSTAADAASSGTIDAIAGSTGDASASGLIDVPPAPPGGVGAVDPATGGIISNVASGADLPPPSANDTITLASTSENAADPAAKLAADTTARTGGADVSAGGLINSAPVPTPDASTATGSSLPMPTGAGTGAAPSDLIGVPPEPPGGVGTVDPVTGSVTGGGSSSGIFGSILDFAKKNPVVALGALQAGGSLLSGATSTLTPAQVNALNAQAAANDAAASLTKQQTANLAAPKAVASSAPVTGTPQPLVPQAARPAGLINSAPQTLVTGKAA